MKRKQEWMPQGIVDQIEKYEFARALAQKHLNSISTEMRAWQAKLHDQAVFLLESEGLDFHDRGLWFDPETSWRCDESPIGVCVTEDSDYCIFCDQPEERK